MNHLLKTTLFFFLLTYSLQSMAQAGGLIWIGSKTSKSLANSNATAIHKMWKDTWDANKRGATKKIGRHTLQMQQKSVLMATSLTVKKH